MIFRKAVLSLILLWMVFLAACTFPATKSNLTGSNQTSVPDDTAFMTPESETSQAPGDSPTAVPARVLSVCTAREPVSLFLYGDNSLAARLVREAIYDGSLDVIDFGYSSEILTKIPALEDGDVKLVPVSVQPGDLIVSATGDLTILSPGVEYFPAGCRSVDCTQVYGGGNPVEIDHLVVQYTLRQDILWSDGTPLTADDSLYSYEVARALFPKARVDSLSRTQDYQALDSRTLEWRGIPGFFSGAFATFLFDPLPRHAWGSLAPEELLSAEISSRHPIGWGPYTIESWEPGDLISLLRNPNYFRSSEDLPKFENLVYRFIPNGSAAVQALQNHECDILDESYRLESKLPDLRQLEQSGQLQIVFNEGTAWTHLDFNLQPLTSDGSPAISLFVQKEVRQALAGCIDRSLIVAQLFSDQVPVLDVYLSPDHPLANPDVAHYEFDPQAASAVLESLGWTDHDGDASTARLANGVLGVPDGIPLQFTLLAADDLNSQRSTEIIRDSLADCGVQVDVSLVPAQELLKAGPEGQVFGRQFQTALYTWATSLEPPCFLYSTSEIPGSYPQYPKGWGGANASGFSSQEYDRACAQARASLPGELHYTQSHAQAQSIFSIEIPSLPLYQDRQVIVTRPDLCGLAPQPSGRSILWNLEFLDYGEGCNAEGSILLNSQACF